MVGARKMKKLENQYRGAGQYLPRALRNQPLLLLQLGVTSMPRQRALTRHFLQHFSWEVEMAREMPADQLADAVLEYISWRLSLRRRHKERWAWSTLL